MDDSIHRASTEAAMQIAAFHYRTMLQLKSWCAPSQSAGRSPTLAGQPLPNQVGATSDGAVHILAVGPGEWLLQSHRDDPTSLRTHLSVEAQRLGIALVDLSDAFAGFRLSGSAVTDVLSKGCGLDWHVSRFPAGHCARTRLANVLAVVERTKPQQFELHVPRSFSEYMEHWLRDAAVC